METLDSRVIRFKMSPKQQDALKVLMLPEVEELLYGGAKGGGKSVFGCEWVVSRALEVIKTCKLIPSDIPPVVGFMGRKQSVDFTSTTLETWKRFIPSDLYEIKSSEKLIIINGTVSIRYGGLDDSETIKKFNSMELAFYFIDQAEECSENDIGLLRGTLRLKLNEIQPSYKGLLTANPAQCWLKKAFITAPQTGTKFIKALPSDNPFIDSVAYIAQLKKAFSFNPPLLKAYLEGSWEGLDQAGVVIPYAEVMRNVHNEFVTYKKIKRITVCDPSEGGPLGADETVIYDFVNTRIDEEEIYSHRDPMDTVGRLIAHQKKNKSNLICVDKVGIGAGIYSRLVEVYREDKKVRIYGFDGRLSPPGILNEMTFLNYKTWAWFKTQGMMMSRLCALPDDPTLHEQLSGVTWRFTNGDIIMLDINEVVRQKLGCSPDRATTYVMAMDALDKADYITIHDGWASDKKSQFSAATV